VDENDDNDDVPGLSGTHNGDNDYMASQFSVQQRAIHFLGKRNDQQKNRLNVESSFFTEFIHHMYSVRDDFSYPVSEEE